MNLNREFLDDKYKNRLTRIAGIQLQQSKIQVVDKDTFIGLENLHSIDLSQNEIKNLDKDTFSGLTNLREIWLNNNQLESLDKDIFMGLGDLQSIYLHDNNFKCDPLELNLENSVQYITLNNGWRNDKKAVKITDHVHKKSSSSLETIKPVSLNSVAAVEPQLVKPSYHNLASKPETFTSTASANASTTSETFKSPLAPTQVDLNKIDDNSITVDLSKTVAATTETHQQTLSADSSKQTIKTAIDSLSKPTAAVDYTKTEASSNLSKTEISLPTLDSPKIQVTSGVADSVKQNSKTSNAVETKPVDTPKLFSPANNSSKLSATAPTSDSTKPIEKKTTNDSLKKNNPIVSTDSTKTIGTNANLSKLSSSNLTKDSAKTDSKTSIAISAKKQTTIDSGKLSAKAVNNDSSAKQTSMPVIPTKPSTTSPATNSAEPTTKTNSGQEKELTKITSTAASVESVKEEVFILLHGKDLLTTYPGRF